MKAFTCELPVCCLDHRISFISVGSEKHCNFESSLTALAPLLLDPKHLPIHGGMRVLPKPVAGASMVVIGVLPRKARTPLLTSIFREKPVPSPI
jgi:hypothetical protein